MLRAMFCPRVLFALVDRRASGPLDDCRLGDPVPAHLGVPCSWITVKPGKLSAARCQLPPPPGRRSPPGCRDRRSPWQGEHRRSWVPAQPPTSLLTTTTLGRTQPSWRIRQRSWPAELGCAERGGQRRALASATTTHICQIWSRTAARLHHVRTLRDIVSTTDCSPDLDDMRATAPSQHSLPPLHTRQVASGLAQALGRTPLVRLANNE